ncbi:MAG: hypothetical protein ACXWUM_00550 [Burkholderiaceae bacterium]
MSWYKLAAIVCTSAVATITNAQAQQAQRSAAPPTVVRDPGDPRAAVPPVEYRSAFSRYRLNDEAEVGSWREKNDDVRRIGGWRVYGREAIVDSNAAEKASDDAKAPTDVTPKPSHGHQHPGVK